MRTTISMIALAAALTVGARTASAQCAGDEYECSAFEGCCHLDDTCGNDDNGCPLGTCCAGGGPGVVVVEDSGCAIGGKGAAADTTTPTVILVALGLVLLVRLRWRARLAADDRVDRAAAPPTRLGPDPCADPPRATPSEPSRQ